MNEYIWRGTCAGILLRVIMTYADFYKIFGCVRVLCVCSSLALCATYPQQFKAALLRPAGTGTVAGLVVCVIRCDQKMQLLRPSYLMLFNGYLKLSFSAYCYYIILRLQHEQTITLYSNRHNSNDNNPLECEYEITNNNNKLTSHDC